MESIFGDRGKPLALLEIAHQSLGASQDPGGHTIITHTHICEGTGPGGWWEAAVRQVRSRKVSLGEFPKSPTLSKFLCDP